METQTRETTWAPPKRSCLARSAAMRGDPAGASISKDVKRCLQLHLTPISANLVLGRACARCGVSPHSLSSRHLRRLLTELAPLLAGYLSRSQARQALQELRSLERTAGGNRGGRAGSSGEPLVIRVAHEDHIDRARSAALCLCRDQGMGNVDSVKVATVVSELSRNILQYADHGTITLIAINGARTGVRVVAEDQGPGIPHLRDVLDGRWRSRTGMGLGLLGSRRLMSSFDIQQEMNKGTRVTAEKYLS